MPREKEGGEGIRREGRREGRESDWTSGGDKARQGDKARGTRRGGEGR